MENLDIQDYVAANLEKYKTRIDGWIAAGPRDIKNKAYLVANKAIAAKAITQEDFDALLTCIEDEPEPDYGMCKFSFPLKECRDNPEFKESIASLMAVLAFFAGEN